MYIQPISTNKAPKFNGKLIIKGDDLPNSVKSYLMNSEAIKNLTVNNDVVVHSSSRYAVSDDVWHELGEKLFKLKISILKEGSLFDQVKDFFHLIPRKELSKHYHSIDGTISCVRNKEKMNSLLTNSCK